MAVESASVEKLCGWLAEGSPARSSNPAAETLAGKLAVLVFQGDAGWASHLEKVDEYRSRLAAWFADRSAQETQFAGLTGADSDPGAFIDWFLQVVLEWETGAALPATAAGRGAEASAAFQNPNWDGTPGTEFYRLDPANQHYEYAGSADGQDWASYEQRRYSKPVRNDSYGTECRYDHRDGVYEWYDAATETWRDQAWAEQHAAAAANTAAPAPVDARTAAWDETWGKFYRITPGGEYEFADALIPGQMSSGCGNVWLSQEAALATAHESTAGRHDATATPVGTHVATRINEAMAEARSPQGEEMGAEEETRLNQLVVDLSSEFERIESLLGADLLE